MAFGLPAGYWNEVLKVPRWQGSDSFIDWLRGLEPSSGFFETVYTAAEWRVDQPFFNVPGVKGGLRSFKSRVEGGLLREIDIRTGAKPMFAVSGIPGTVGSGTRALWMELIPCLTDDRDFAVWPFEGRLDALLATGQIVLAESYPGLAYAVALAEALPTHRIVVSKTKQEAREQACGLLEEARWVREADVDLGDLAAARADEDAFDSHFTAAAALRCLIEGQPLCDPTWIDEKAEGAMLLAGPVDPTRPSKKFRIGTSGTSVAPTSTQARLDLGESSSRTRCGPDQG
ncbi:MAG: hypothetical protein IH936_11400 [Acidobacteria bacterium]|nr:hypothetical protein [Acidobacteriota bacterium]